MTQSAAKVLLKARPTPAQLADRLQAPLPEGLELYLDVADISGDAWLDRLLAGIDSHPLPADFAWIVEGPLRSLDGAYFDIARGAEADREVVRRIIACAQRLNARGVVIHCMALKRSATDLTKENWRRAMERSEGMLAFYAKSCIERGLVPTIENVPPVARMRESAYTYPIIGMSATDLAHFCDLIPGLRATCDTSHAQLYLNAAASDPAVLLADLAPVARFAKESNAPADLNAYLEVLGDRVFEGHISNAAGLLDEGLPYEQGVANLDSAVKVLLGRARYLVTEPIEPVPNRAEYMRAMAKRIMAVRERVVAGGTLN